MGFTLFAMIAGHTFFSTSFTITALFSGVLFRKPAAAHVAKIKSNSNVLIYHNLDAKLSPKTGYSELGLGLADLFSNHVKTSWCKILKFSGLGQVQFGCWDRLN